MDKRLPESFTFSLLKKRPIQPDFSSGQITPDAGFLMMREIGHRCQLTQNVAAGLEDSRQESKVKHELVDLLRQRVYGPACGYYKDLAYSGLS
ncbi:MAG: transposase [Hahellaceae bacterium]|nr:transposase [Hahellaceae bacterium]